ncbi:hypothetical protein FRC05_011694 [Tulasnella sp. 425]|nr:hypothetical protein FRC05_011694 [Tulasnella sp. 425]
MADLTGILLSLPTPSETDLLIRSLTTALVLFSPNSDSKDKNRYHRSARFDQFDRMSLFFVSGASGDAAAITALTEGNYVTFQIVQAQAYNGQFAVVKNPEHSLDSNPNEDSEASGRLSPEALNEPARRCLRRGAKSISPKTHGATLQHLLRSLYQAEPEDKEKATTILHRYIYSFCVDKISRRFNSKIPGFKLSYVSLLLPSTDNITFEDYQAHSKKTVILPQRLVTRDESILHQMLTKRFPDQSFKLSDSRPQQLTLDVECQWTVWTFFQHFLRQAQDCLNDRAAKSKQDKLKEEEIQTALQRLDELMEALAVIYLLAHRSPSFWIVMGRMAPLLEARLDPETHGNHTHSAGSTPHPGPSRDSAEHSLSSATDTRPDHHPSTPHSMATVDADISEESDDDDATSDAETTRHVPSARRPKQPEELHDVISKYWPHVTIMVRHWMKSIAQWHHGLEDLNRGPKKLGILSKSLSIDVTVAPVSPLPTQQASLIDTIKSTFPDSDTKDMLSILRSNATLLCENGAKEDLLRTLANRDLTDDMVSDTWKLGFRGGIHCEAQLAYQIFQKSPVNDGDIVEHGKIYSWSPPYEAPEEKKQIVLGELRDKFISYMQGCVPLTNRTPDPGSSNNSDESRRSSLLKKVAAKMK